MISTGLDTLERFPQAQPYLDMIEGQRMDLTWTRYPRSRSQAALLPRRWNGGIDAGVMGWTRPIPRPHGVLVEYLERWRWALPISSPTSCEMSRRQGRGRSICHRKISSDSDTRVGSHGWKAQHGWRELMVFHAEGQKCLRARSRCPLVVQRCALACLDITAPLPGIPDAIERIDYDVFNQRAYVSRCSQICRVIRDCSGALNAVPGRLVCSNQTSSGRCW